MIPLSFVDSSTKSVLEHDFLKELCTWQNNEGTLSSNSHKYNISDIILSWNEVRGGYMNHISGKLEQLLALQKTLCKEYEKENKVLLETIEAQKEQIYLLERIVNNQNKIIKELEKS